jgi:serine/threonine protein kinase/Tfp pilus assembly protein PilF
MLPRDTLLDNRYRLIELLGTGAMGSVYLALDERLSCNVAVKGTIFKQFRLTEDAEINLRRAFEREAKLLANLQHEAIPRVGDYFFFEDEQYLVMEYIAGMDLFEQAEKQRRKAENFDAVTVSDWALQLLDALHYLHTQPEPVIHKDIKLSNLKISARNRVKLLDFGISKGYAGEMTRVEAGSLQMGTEEYAPIEQFLKFPSKAADTLRQALSIKHADKVEAILRQNTDARSDLYSLGVTVYRLLTGKPPADYMPRALAVWENQPDPIVPVNELNPNVPKSVSDVILHALALDKEDRPASADAMRDEFQRAWSEHIHLPPEIERAVVAETKEDLQAEFGDRLAEETRRREEAEAALASREREIVAITARLSEIAGNASASIERGSFPKASDGAVDGDGHTSFWSKFARNKKTVWIAAMFFAVAGFILFWQAREETARARELEQRIARGKAFLSEKAYDDAVAEYTAAISLDAKSSENYANRGEAFRRKQNYEAALRDFNEALKLDRRNVFALTNRADIACQKSDYDRAFADFNEVLRINSSYDYLYERRGSCFENRKLYRDAINDYTRAIALDAGESWTHFRRGLVYFLINEDEKAVADFSEVLRMSPDDYAAYSNRGMAYQRMNKRRQAEADFQKAKELKEADAN